MSFGFEKPPTPASPDAEQVPQFEFSGRSLTDIFRTLKELNDKGTIKGSSAEYTPRELVILIIDAVRAMDRYDIDREEKTLGGHVPDGPAAYRALPPEDYMSLPAFAAITRSNGLREALLRARQNETRGIRESTPLNGEVLDIFRSLTGGYPGY